MTAERWRELYERHREWFLVAVPVSVLSFVVARIFLSGWIAPLAAACAVALVWALRKREFKKQQFRVIEYH
jgi:uncharacterized membrane protein